MEIKKCKRCNIEKTIDMFYVSYKPTGRRENICKACKSIQTSIAKKIRKQADPIAYKKNHNIINKRSYDNRPGVRRLESLKYLYGIDNQWYEAKLKEQNNTCGICGKHQEDGKFLCIDHNHNHHDNKKKACNVCLRGLLCHKCNRGIGNFNDDVNIIMNAIKYVEKYS